MANQGRIDQSLAHLREAISIRERQLGPDHPLVAARLEELSRTLLASGDLEAAEAAARSALTINEAALPQGHSSISDTERLLEEVVGSRR